VKPIDPEKLLTNVGRRIAELRAARGLTQEALAEALGITARWVQSAEAGRENFTLTTLVRFANSLEVPVADLFLPSKGRKPGPGRPRSPSP
jgi:transcriptional regulator with XRE-family HTH domain